MKDPRTILFYGDTGSSKTTQLALIAKWLWETKQKRTRLISCDGGGSKQFDDMGLIEAGIVDRFIMPATEHKIANLYRLSKGYWPHLYDDGSWQFNHTSAYMTTPEEFSKIGAYMFDSITGMGEILTEHVSDPVRTVGFKLGTKTNEDGYSFGTLDEGHYLIIQKELRKAFEFGFNYIPVDYMFATARVGLGKGSNKASTFGPAAAGSAITADIPSWFNDLYFLESRDVKIENNLYNAKVAWFVPHNDLNNSLPYPAKPRCLPTVFTELQKLYPEGYAVLYPEDGFTEFLTNLETLNKKVRKYANSKVKLISEAATS